VEGGAVTHQDEHVLLRPRPKWAVIVALIIILPLALYVGVYFGLNGVDYIFPTATVRCQ
jgi:hypothetical protein